MKLFASQRRQLRKYILRNFNANSFLRMRIMLERQASCFKSAAVNWGHIWIGVPKPSAVESFGVNTKVTSRWSEKIISELESFWPTGFGSNASLGTTFGLFCQNKLQTTFENVYKFPVYFFNSRHDDYRPKREPQSTLEWSDEEGRPIASCFCDHHFKRRYWSWCPAWWLLRFPLDLRVIVHFSIHHKRPSVAQCWPQLPFNIAVIQIDLVERLLHRFVDSALMILVLGARWWNYWVVSMALLIYNFEVVHVGFATSFVCTHYGLIVAAPALTLTIVCHWLLLHGTTLIH